MSSQLPALDIRIEHILLVELTFATKRVDKSMRSAAAECRSGAMAESMRYETFTRTEVRRSFITTTVPDYLCS